MADSLLGSGGCSRAGFMDFGFARGLVRPPCFEVDPSICLVTFFARSDISPNLSMFLAIEVAATAMGSTAAVASATIFRCESIESILPATLSTVFVAFPRF